MKKLIFTLVALFPFYVKAQINLSLQGTNIEYQEVVPCKGSAVNLYKKLAMWANDPGDSRTLQIVKSDSFQITGVNKGFRWYIVYKERLESKENKYRYSFYDFEYDINGLDERSVYNLNEIYNRFKRGQVGPDKGPFESKKAYFYRTNRAFAELQQDITRIISNLKNTMTINDSW